MKPETRKRNARPVKVDVKGHDGKAGFGGNKGNA